jgi:diguanylate cyclase (GGDEF)-like protein
LADVTAAYLVNAQARADLQDASERSHQNSMHDALTGLPNRLLLVERLEHALARGPRSDKLMAILFVDLDRFKSVNDTHGHRAGDHLLVAVANRLTSLLRPGDTLARMSGDEFVILCEDLEHESQAEAIAARIVDALTIPFPLLGLEVAISASVGVAFSGRGEQVPDQLLQDADMAMYQVKRSGGAHHQVIDLRERQLAQHRATLQSDLRGAIGRSELRVDYQPIVRSGDGRILGMEALLRWDHPARGLIPPMTTVPLAEQAGLVTGIGRWVLEQACTDRQRWFSELDASLAMAVNVSAHELMAADFADTVTSVLASTGTSAELLTLEITESVFVQDAERALIVLDEIKDLGVMLALDDFGTGYSSLNHLKRFPVDAVKIDRSFVADLVRDRSSHAMFHAVVDLAHALEMAVVTEGVETAEQREEVVSLGSEACQGFYFAHPMGADALATLTRTATAGLRLPVGDPMSGAGSTVT